MTDNQNADAPPTEQPAEAASTDSATVPEPATKQEEPTGPTRNVVVRFRVPGSEVNAKAPAQMSLKARDQVVVQGEHGSQIATYLRNGTKKQKNGNPVDIQRLATSSDYEVADRNKTREKEAFIFCKERLREHKLPMKLIDVEFTHSGARALFFFTSNERVDFRTLVKDLARRFHTRIEMRQVGVRDAARHTGGVGICGRQLCCSTWLSDFEPVSIRMAKDQNLSLNHQKLSGLCGRLRCCLQYEQSLYYEQRKGLPKMGKRVITPEGEGRVKDINVLKRRIRVQLTETRSYVDFDADELSRPDEQQQQKSRAPQEATKSSTETPKEATSADTTQAPPSSADETGETKEGEEQKRSERPRGGRSQRSSRSGRSSRGGRGDRSRTEQNKDTSSGSANQSPTGQSTTDEEKQAAPRKEGEEAKPKSRRRRRRRRPSSGSGSSGSGSAPPRAAPLHPIVNKQATQYKRGPRCLNEF